MNLRTLLRASLVPLGLALAARGIENLRAEADELRELAAARRAFLADAGPDPDEPEHQAAEQYAGCGDDRCAFCAAWPPAPAPDPEKLELFRPQSNLRRNVALGVIAASAAGLALIRARRRAEQAAAVNAARSAQLAAQPPAPGSPADLAARRPYGPPLIPRTVLAEVAHADKHRGTFVPTLADCPEHGPGREEKGDELADVAQP